MKSTPKRVVVGVISGFVVAVASVPITWYLVNQSDSGCRDWAAEFARDRVSLPSLQDPTERAGALAEAAKVATQVGEFAAAEAWATEALKLLPTISRNWNFGNVIHNAHLALGRVALARGDRVRAREELLLAGRTPGSPQLDSFGPNMLLARDMLRAGEREVVFEYFDECRRFWKFGDSRLRRWRRLASWHIPPDFGANLLF
jgi:hypothetical protein